MFDLVQESKTMRKIWVRVDPWDKKIVTTALEGGADGVMVPKGFETGDILPVCFAPSHPGQRSKSLSRDFSRSGISRT